ncbi:MAG: HIT domain-containing protein, partial [Bacillota bacterium]
GGQTVFHLHVHVIPRYRGDVPDPRGGIRRIKKPLVPYAAEGEV